jgi:hypothetical protein
VASVNGGHPRGSVTASRAQSRLVTASRTLLRKKRVFIFSEHIEPHFRFGVFAPLREAQIRPENKGIRPKSNRHKPKNIMRKKTHFFLQDAQRRPV